MTGKQNKPTEKTGWEVWGAEPSGLSSSAASKNRDLVTAPQVVVLLKTIKERGPRLCAVLRVLVGK